MSLTTGFEGYGGDLLLALALFLITLRPAGATAGIVQQHGRLHVEKGQLCDQQGKPLQLRGMSTHGLQYWPISNATVDRLVDDWHCTIVRAAMYTREHGYIENPGRMKERVRLVIDACIAKGVYVTIDWHILSDNNPNVYRRQAREFFDEMSGRYGKYPNVLYEICNEPHDCSWTEDIRPYAEEIIPVIRAHDPDGVVLCGNGNWSSEPHVASENPLNFPGVLYTLHYYAATHDLPTVKRNIEACLANGCGVFVSEWGISEASGSGRVDTARGAELVEFLARKKISWCMWAISPGPASSNALKAGVSLDGPWSDDQLGPTGIFAKEYIKERTE